MNFQVFHDYNRLVRRGVVQPLKHVCGNEFTLRKNHEDEPVLQCLYCGSTTRPGLGLYRQIEAVVKEHFL